MGPTPSQRYFSGRESGESEQWPSVSQNAGMLAMLVDPTTPFLEIACPTLGSDTLKRPDLDAVVQGNRNGPNLPGIRVRVFEDGVVTPNPVETISEFLQD